MFRYETFGSIEEAPAGKGLGKGEWQEAVVQRAAALPKVANSGMFAIVHAGTVDFFLDLFAVWHVGGCAACLSPGMTASELDNVLRWLEPEAVLVDKNFDTKLGNVTPPVIDLSKTKRDKDDCPARTVSTDEPALLLFTSGTTGVPKAVSLSFGAIRQRTAWNRDAIGDLALARTLCVLPTHFGHGLIGNCLTPLLAGASLVIDSRAGIRDIARLGDAIDTYAVTFMSSVPAYWNIALKAGRPPRGESLRRVHIGSAPLSAQLWSSVGDWTGCPEVVNAYGITEAANWIAGASSLDFQPEDGLVGRPWGGDVAVLDQEGNVRESGDGEILIRSPTLFSGYRNRPDLTAKAMRDGWYRTGDIGEIDRDGVVYLRGRRNDEINRAGLKINPAEIDLLLEHHPDIAEACCFSVPDPVSGEAVAVAVKPAGVVTLSVNDLRAWCSKKIRQEAVPERWYIVDDLPKSERGKLIRNSVRDKCLQLTKAT